MILFLFYHSTLTQGRVFFWQCRHRRVFVPAAVSCGLHSQGRHDSKSSLQCAHPVFWSCIRSTWIIKLLARPARVTFVVVSKGVLSQHRATVAIDQRLTGDGPEYNQDRPLLLFFPTLFVCLLYHPFSFSFLSSWFLLSFVFHSHFSVKHSYVHTHTFSHSPFVSYSLYCLSHLSPSVSTTLFIFFLLHDHLFSSKFHSPHLSCHLVWITDDSKSTPMLHAIAHKHLYRLYLNLIL